MHGKIKTLTPFLLKKCQLSIENHYHFLFSNKRLFFVRYGKIKTLTPFLLKKCQLSIENHYHFLFSNKRLFFVRYVCSMSHFILAKFLMDLIINLLTLKINATKIIILRWPKTQEFLIFFNVKTRKKKSLFFYAKHCVLKNIKICKEIFFSFLFKVWLKHLIFFYPFVLTIYLIHDKKKY